MFLSKDEYLPLIRERKIVENYIEENAQTISYDLRIDYILSNDDRHDKLDYFSLAPGATVFIASMENIKVPEDMFFKVIERYSSIRRGIAFESPVYIPGHYTKVFTRITNISNDIIELHKNDSVVSVMFYQLAQKVGEPYKGTYQGEFDFKKAGIYHDVPAPNVVKVKNEIEEKVNSVKDIEKKIYDHIMIIMTVFIAAFSLVNLNINFLSSSKTLIDMLVYNLTFLGGLGILVTFISVIMEHVSTSVKVGLGVVSLALIAAALILVFCAVM